MFILRYYSAIFLGFRKIIIYLGTETEFLSRDLRIRREKRSNAIFMVDYKGVSEKYYDYLAINISNISILKLKSPPRLARACYSNYEVWDQFYCMLAARTRITTPLMYWNYKR